MKIIVDLAGGFGNQLFCYCFGYVLAKEKNAEFLIDTSMQDNGIARELELLNFKVVYDKRISYPYRKGILNKAITNKVVKKRAIGWNTVTYWEKFPTRYEPEVYSVCKDTYFRGCWQTEKYFKKYKDELISLLEPIEKRTDSVNNIILKVRGEKSVAVHIRRGDYLQVYGNISMQYYAEAFELLQRKTGDGLCFYIFSDDIDYCKSYFKAYEDRWDIIYPQYTSDNMTLDDMLIMSNCRHLIIANSTYSWWAAWLNQNPGKIVICPEWGMWSGDFYPEEWIKISI